MIRKRSNWDLSSRDARRAAFRYFAELLVLETGTAHPLFRLALHVADTGSKRAEKRFWDLAGRTMPPMILDALHEALEEENTRLEIVAHRAELAAVRLSQGRPEATGQAVVASVNAKTALARFSPRVCR